MATDGSAPGDSARACQAMHSAKKPRLHGGYPVFVVELRLVATGGYLHELRRVEVVYASRAGVTVATAAPADLADGGCD